MALRRQNLINAGRLVWIARLASTGLTFLPSFLHAASLVPYVQAEPQAADPLQPELNASPSSESYDLPAVEADIDPSPAPQSLKLRLAQLENELLEILERQVRYPRDTALRRRRMVILEELSALERAQDVWRNRRLQEMKARSQECETRLNQLEERQDVQKGRLRKLLSTLGQITDRPEDAVFPALSERGGHGSLGVWDQERNLAELEGPRRVVFARLAQHTVQALQSLKGDLAQARTIRAQILAEKDEWGELAESTPDPTLLSLNRDLSQSDAPQNVPKAMGHLRQEKATELAIEKLLHRVSQLPPSAPREDAQARAPEEQTAESFAARRGYLALPVDKGQIIGHWGQAHDAESGRAYFRKGLDLSGTPGAVVRAWAAGRVLIAETVPHLGGVVLLDHGQRYRSLLAHLDRIQVKTGAWVDALQTLGYLAEVPQPPSITLPLRLSVWIGSLAINPEPWIFK